MRRHDPVHRLALVLVCLLIASIPIEAAVLHVPIDYPTIQDAIDAAADGDEILIAPGTYAQASLSIDEKAITIGGAAGAESTMLEFTAPGPVGLHVRALESDTVIENLTIANSGVHFGVGVVYLIGTPVIRDCIFENNEGNYPSLINAPSDMASGATIQDCVFRNNTIPVRCFGMTIDGCTFFENSGQSAVLQVFKGSVTNCHFEANHSTANGGGAVNIVTAGDVVLDECTFLNNAAGASGGGAIGVASLNEGDHAATIRNCSFDGNGANAVGGGAIHAAMVAGTAIILNCAFAGNSAPEGGAVWLGTGATMQGSSLTSNSAAIGGAVALHDGSSIVGCVLSGNDADRGGAIAVMGTTATILDCTASGNAATVSGGGLHVPSEVIASATDSTFCMNAPDQIDLSGLLIANNVLACDMPLDHLGACCLPAGLCVETTESSCRAAGGSYFGDGTVCADAECATSCAGDVDGDGVVDVNDLLIVLASWGICL